MTCLKTTPEASTTLPVLLMMLHPLAGQIVRLPELAIVGTSAARPADCPDPARAEYASWMPDPGAIEVASWAAQMQGAAR